MRNIKSYSEKYLIPGFEKYKVLYRRKKVMEIIKKYSPKKILEIGCGNDPLFQYIEDISFTVVEPAENFYNHAVRINKANGNVILNGFFEDVSGQLSDKYDMIICSSLLHEVEKPDELLKAIANVCNEDTVVHINVPNAHSMHRLLGKEMGILADIHDMSRNNLDFQQNNVFDMDSLQQILCDNGFKIIDCGGYFVKPFSHEQMQAMLDSGIIDEKTLDGLYELTKFMPEFASEIYANCKLNNGELNGQ